MGIWLMSYETFTRTSLIPHSTLSKILRYTTNEIKDTFWSIKIMIFVNKKGFLQLRLGILMGTCLSGERVLLGCLEFEIE